MKKIVFLLVLVGSFAFCKPYAQIDPTSFFGTQKADGAQKINLDAMFKSVESLYEHASFYPLNFDSQNDKEKAEYDLGKLIEFFDSFKENKVYEVMQQNDKEYFDLCQARLFVMGHNFDKDGMAQKAVEAYEKLLTNDKNGKIRTEFAEFLGNAGLIDRAVDEFNKAIELGSHRAYYGLSVASMMQGKRDESVAYMQKYIDKFPHDNEAKKMLEIFKTAEIKRETAKP